MRWAALGLCALALIADSPAPRPPAPTFSCLVQEGQVILNYQGSERDPKHYAGREHELEVYESDDGGLSWNRLVQWQNGRVTEYPDPALPGPSLERLTAIRDSCIFSVSNPQLHNPARPDVQYHVRDDGVFRSSDGGRTFSQEVTLQGAKGALIDEETGNLIVRGPDASVRMLVRTPDGAYRWVSPNTVSVTGFIQALAIDPQTPATVYAGTTGYGVSKTVDGGAHWFSAGSGLAGAIEALAIDPQAPATVYAGTNTDAFVLKSTDGGVNWSPAGAGLEDSEKATAARIGIITSPALAINPHTRATVYAGEPAGVFKSTDGGAHWQLAWSGSITGSVAALAIDPQAPATLYAATTYGIFKSTDGGASWSPANTGLPSNTTECLALAIDPQTAAILYLGTQDGLFKSTDGGAHWTSANAGLASYGSSHVNVLAVDPQTPSTLYAGKYQNGVFRSVDGGAHWSPANAGLTGTILALAVDPQASGTLYAGTDSGAFLFKSVDGGAVGSPANAGLPNPRWQPEPTLVPTPAGAPSPSGQGTSAPGRAATDQPDAPVSVQPDTPR